MPPYYLVISLQVVGLYLLGEDSFSCDAESLHFDVVICDLHNIAPKVDERVFITNVKGTFLGMSESGEASKRR